MTGLSLMMSAGGAAAAAAPERARIGDDAGLVGLEGPAPPALAGVGAPTQPAPPPPSIAVPGEGPEGLAAASVLHPALAPRAEIGGGQV